MITIHRNTSIDWKPSPIVALATSIDESQVAAAREDGSLEIWLVSPGSATWHCQLTIHGDPNSRVSCLVWCRSGSKSGTTTGRLLSSSIDGSISEWDLFNLKHKTVLDSIGVSIWQMAVEPSEDPQISAQNGSHPGVNGYANNGSLPSDDARTSETDDDNEMSEIDDVNSGLLFVRPTPENQRVALGCDDGCVRLYAVPDSDGLVYNRSFPRVSGRVLSVVWSLDAKLIFAGSSDGFIRCWDAKMAHEIYRITVGHGGFGSGPELCVWSLLFLRSGTVVSADSTGSVQFWDSRHGTLMQTHSFHKGEVNTLAAAPNHNRVFSAGSDGQVILYKLSSDEAGSGNHKKWVYVGYVRAHTHDVKSLTVAVPINTDPVLSAKVKRARRREKPDGSTYLKWAYAGSPMLLSAGDDTKLFSYPVKEFTKFIPHDICPVPQRVPVQLVLNTVHHDASLVLVQCTSSLDILRVDVKSAITLGKGLGAKETTQLVVRIKSKAARKIVCSTVSPSGAFFAYSDNLTPCLFELKSSDIGKSAWAVPEKRPLRRKLPYAHSMVFSADSSRLMIAGQDKKIYVVDVLSAGVLCTFRPCRKADDDKLHSAEPPITKMFTSSNGKWLAAINCFGDIYVFNLELQRQHWFISRLDGASVTAGGFPPRKNNRLTITTSSNQVYFFDVEGKQLAEWFILPRKFQELPGEVIGLSFPACSHSTSVTIYSSRVMCSIDYGMPVQQEDDGCLANGLDLTLKKLQSSPNIKVLKRKRKDALQPKLKHTNEKEIRDFRDPVLFVGHLSDDSVLVMEKPWREVVKTFEAPVHRHIFGT